MSKQKDYEKISFNLKKKWVRVMDQLRARRDETRTEWLKNLIISKCIESDAGTSVDNSQKTDGQK